MRNAEDYELIAHECSEDRVAKSPQLKAADFEAKSQVNALARVREAEGMLDDRVVLVEQLQPKPSRCCSW